MIDGPEAETCEAAAEPPADVLETGRLVPADNGAAITLTLYRGAEVIAAVTPRRRGVPSRSPAK